MTVVSPPTPRRDEPEALIEEAWELTRRRRHRRFAAAFVLLVVMGGAVIVGVSQSGGQTARGDGRGSAAAADPGFVGRVWFSRTTVDRLTPAPIVPRVMGVGQKPGPVPIVYFRTRTSYETWIGSDGSFRQREVVLSASFATAGDASVGERPISPCRRVLPSAPAATAWISATVSFPLVLTARRAIPVTRYSPHGNCWGYLTAHGQCSVHCWEPSARLSDARRRPTCRAARTTLPT
jgi:hypothetical protein